MTPREYIEAKWAAAVPGVELVDASNIHIDADSLPSPWVGMLVQTEARRAVTMGTAPYTEELGTVLLGVFTKSGDGSSAADSLARDITQAFLNWRSDDGQFEVRQVNGPMDLEPEADGNWHRLALELDYGMWGQASWPA